LLVKAQGKFSIEYTHPHIQVKQYRKLHDTKITNPWLHITEPNARNRVGMRLHEYHNYWGRGLSRAKFINCLLL